jgi:hypothetical protein
MMQHSTFAAAAATLVAAAAGCGPSTPPAGSLARTPRVDAGGAASPGSTSAQVQDAGATTSAGELGGACTAPERFQRGTCREGLSCAPLPGGYCLATAPCSADAAVVPTMRIGEVCAKPCTSNADCRVSEGYVCDAQYSGCIFPRLAPSPKLAACTAPAPPRRVFGPVTQLSTSAAPGTYQFEPSAALDAHGNLVVLYTAGSPIGTVHPLATSVVHSDGRVERDRPFLTNRRTHFDPWLTSGKDGNLVAVWLGFDSPMAPEQRAIIGLSRSTDGSTWSSPVTADDAESDCPNERPGCLDKGVVVAGPDHRDPKREAVYVLYMNEPDRGTRMVRSTDGGTTFGKSTVVTPSDDVYNMTVSEAGVLHVAYRVEQPARFEYVRSRDGGATFSAPRVVSGPGERADAGGFSNPQVVADERRNVLYVAYPEGGPDGRWDIVLASSTDEGATWARTKVNDDAPCANHMLPMAKLDPATGKVHVVWLENRTGQGGVAYAACVRAKGAVTASCSPNEAVNDAPFASYILTRHSPKWLGEYGSLVLDTKKRVLHAVWTQTVAEPSGPTARIFHAAARL